LRRTRIPIPAVAAAATAALAAGVAAVAAAPAVAVNYVTSANGTSWGVHDAAAPALDTGSLRSASGSSIQGFGNIKVGVSTTPAPRLNGEMMRGFGLRFYGLDRFRTTTPVDLGGVSISRTVRVNRSANWTRFLDTFTNTTGAPITVDSSFGGALAFSTPALVTGTSSGDATVGDDDAWIVVQAGTQRPVGVVLGQPAPFERFARLGNQQRTPFQTPLATSGVEAGFYGFVSELTLAPGESRTFARFVLTGESGAGTAAAVQTAAAALTAEPELSDLSDAQICALANFDPAALPGYAGLDCAATEKLPVPAASAAAAPTTSARYDVVDKTIAQLQADMEAGVTTSEEITRAYLDRIAAYDTGQFGVHAFIHVAADAIEQAKAADAARSAGRRGGLLGIPVGVKDLYDTKDMPTTGGTLALEGWQPREDAFQIAKLRDAGAVIIGKTNLSEFANSGSMSESGYMQTWNGLYPSKTSFGSSGGSAAAVAASMAGFAMGSQTGVSLYAPSTGQSLVTLRGTDGISSTRGAMPLTWAQDFAGPIARSVTDIAYILNVTNGTDPGELVLTRDADAHKVDDYTDYLDADALRGKRIGYLPSAYVSRYAQDDGTADAVRAHFADLEAAGATMVEMPAAPSPPPSVVPSGASLGIEGWERYIAENPGFPFATGNELLTSPKVLPYNRQATNTSRPLTDEEVDRYIAWRTEYKALYSRWMDDNGVDAVVYPGFISDMWDNDSSFNGSDRATGVPTSNVGLPTVVLPVGVNPHGYSISMQIVGRPWSDAEVLGYGYALEQQARGQQHTNATPALAYDPRTPTTPPVIPVPEAPRTEGPIVPSEEGRAPVPAARRVAIKVALAKRAAVRGGKVRFVVRNASAAKVTGTVTLRVKLGRKTVVLGRARVSVGARGRKTLVVTLSRAARRALHSRSKVSATATYALRNATGAKATKKVRLAIRLR